jgi:hypothetical protein
MPKHNQPHQPVQTPSAPQIAAPPAQTESTFGEKAVTVAAIGAAAALIEVELIPGMLLGVAAMLVPGLLPKVGTGLRPLIKGAVRAGYNVAARAREAVAEAGEQFEDIVAEVKAEQHAATTPGMNGHVETPATGPEPA